jgi:hypothetical protein
MDKETLRMQMLSGIITEGEYKAKLEETAQKDSLNEHMIGGIVGVGAINQIPSRAKADYEDAFEHFLGERYQIKPNRERDDIKDVNEEEVKVNEGVIDEIEDYFETMIQFQPKDALALIMDLVRNDGKNWNEWIDNIQADIVDTAGGDYEGDIKGYREELEESKEEENNY